MWLRDKLREYLGINEVLNTAEEDAYTLAAVNRKLDELRTELDRLTISMGPVGATLGKILAKLEPMLAVDELDPERKAQSDAIGNAVIKRLQDEQRARMLTEGRLEARHD